jgi:hypothetical protein
MSMSLNFDVNQIFFFSNRHESMSVRRTMASEVNAGNYTAPEFADQSWRSFGMDTEAGRLLNKLYAGSQHKPKIHYPRVRTRKEQTGAEEDRPKFIPGGGKSTVDPRARTRADTSQMFVPKVGRGAKPKKRHAIDLITRRKAKQEIFDQNKADDVHRMRYRPPLRRPVATDANKRLLQAQFQFKGGKCLPDTGTMQPIEGNLPMHLINGKPSRAQKKRFAAAAVSSMPLTGAEKEDAYTQQLEADFEHAMNEIDARKQFLDDMLRDHGEREQKKHEAEILAQISDLVRSAKALDKKLKARASR